MGYCSSGELLAAVGIRRVTCLPVLIAGISVVVFGSTIHKSRNPPGSCLWLSLLRILRTPIPNIPPHTNVMSAITDYRSLPGQTLCFVAVSFIVFILPVCSVSSSAGSLI